jgi:Fe2+ or Zn2+ uptake regulation protein
MAKQGCTGDHQGHLCVLASNEQFTRIKELTRSPEFICFNCGRVADCKDNLCNPMPLHD